MLELPLVVRTVHIAGRRQTRLTDIRGQETVHIILHECLEVQLLRLLERAVQQSHFIQSETGGIERRLIGVRAGNRFLSEKGHRKGPAQQSRPKEQKQMAFSHHGN